jgi:BirA family biotin operon repressor/biotin-[acetyl-CoA-carboxylase] ligase
LRALTRPLEQARLDELVRDNPLVRRVIVLDEVGSTNDVARRLAEEGDATGTVVLAEYQTAGRGRQGRSWHARHGLGLLLSVLLRPGRPVMELTRWTLGAAVAACEACGESSGAPVAIRWPNDLVSGGRKLGGVLAEVRARGPARHDLVLGLGLNVLQRAEDFPAELRPACTSLQQITAEGTVPSREVLAAAYLSHLAGVVEELERGSWSGVARRFESLASGLHGQKVRVLTPGDPARSYGGVTAGLDEVGAIRVRDASGVLRSVHLAESVRAEED